MQRRIGRGDVLGILHRSGKNQEEEEDDNSFPSPSLLGEEIDDDVSNDDRTDIGTDNDEAIIDEVKLSIRWLILMVKWEAVYVRMMVATMTRSKSDEVESFLEEESNESENVKQKKNSGG